MKLATTALAAVFLAGASANLLFADVTATAHVKPSTRSEFRRREVIRRLDKQNKEILAKIGAGTLTQSRGDALDHRDRAIRAKEERMSAERGGDISRKEQRYLDSLLNDIHMDMAK